MEQTVIAKTAAKTKATPAPFPGYLTPQQQLALARQQAQIDLQPSVQANARAQAQAAEQARNQAAASQAAYSAQAALQAGLAPAIGATYGQAADRQAAYGQGFSGLVKGALDKSTSDANALLAQNGMAQNIASGGQSAKNVLYALGGYNPASVLNAQGAAFQTAADQQPITSRGLGLDAAKAANATGAKNALDLRNQLTDLQARRPGLISQALSGIQSNQNNAYSQFIQGQYLTNTLANGTVNRTGVDPVTGKVAVGYGVDANGNVVPQSTLDKGTAARRAAVTKRDDATVTALAGAHDFVNAQLTTQGTHLIPEGPPVPIKIGMSAAIKDSSGKVVVAASPIYAKKGGGTTHNINDSATKQPWQQVPLPKPAFQQVLNQVTGKLSVQLKRYGYKPAQIRAFALDIVDDYYALTTNLPPLPAKTRAGTNPSGGTTTTTGP